MSRFMQVYEPVEEGWGIALARVGMLAGAGLAGYHLASKLGVKAGVAALKHGASLGTATTVAHVATGAAGGAMGAGIGTVGRKLTTKLTEKTLKSFLENAKIKKYVISQCDKIYNQLKKTNKDVTTEVNWSSFIGAFKYSQASTKNASWAEIFKNNRSSLNNADGKYMKLGKYSIDIYYDTTHIDAIIVVFGIKGTKDEYIGKRIPAPTNAELKKLFEDK